MSKHTPGPWANDLPEREEPYQNICIQVGKRDICLVWIDDDPVDDYNAEQCANAHLIAAAPDLLEALQYMFAVCPAINHQGEEAHQQASAAITKATREQT